ncbi:VOC family protein [Prosthecomicrobium pneumaticum]|uniref:Lactoylglutathione lyase n=1 Tax=Prosthecomicrobium pneumaticum TaxID=81895 RepID=A0A7W9FN07_9HYPH|nr:VOC family protein [Prosthecomicrobium pneumaticum]MBB5753581.1 lactoylglutathione lyase [Prosthecomicrobium pneumaticum]
MQGITGYGHAGLKVRDIERSLAFWRDRLGLSEMMRLHHDDGRLMLVYLRITDTQYLELFPNGADETAPPAHATGVNHLCLTVDDLDEVVERIEAAGISLTIPVKLGLDGNRQAWFEDPDGNRIELMEMAPASLQAKAIRRLAAER